MFSLIENIIRLGLLLQIKTNFFRQCGIFLFPRVTALSLSCVCMMGHCCMLAAGDPSPHVAHVSVLLTLTLWLDWSWLGLAVAPAQLMSCPSLSSLCLSLSHMWSLVIVIICCSPDVRVCPPLMSLVSLLYTPLKGSQVHWSSLTGRGQGWCSLPDDKNHTTEPRSTSS